MAELNLESLKKDYALFQKKYDLPSFNELNRDFRIEKLSGSETDFLLREIRTIISDFLEGFLRFCESILNPVNVPMFLFSVIKSFRADEKERLMELHKNISKLEISAVKLMNYSEKAEAEFIKESFKLWQMVSRDFVSLFESIEGKLENKSTKKTNAYFG